MMTYYLQEILDSLSQEEQQTLRELLRRPGRHFWSGSGGSLWTKGQPTACSACHAVLIDAEGVVQREFRFVLGRFRRVKPVAVGSPPKLIELRERPVVCLRERCLRQVEDDPTWEKTSLVADDED